MGGREVGGVVAERERKGGGRHIDTEQAERTGGFILNIMGSHWLT